MYVGMLREPVVYLCDYVSRPKIRTACRFRQVRAASSTLSRLRPLTRQRRLVANVKCDAPWHEAFLDLASIRNRQLHISRVLGLTAIIKLGHPLPATGQAIG